MTLQIDCSAIPYVDEHEGYSVLIRLTCTCSCGAPDGYSVTYSWGPVFNVVICNSCNQAYRMTRIDLDYDEFEYIPDENREATP